VSAHIFALWHRVRDGTLPRGAFIKEMDPLQAQVVALLEEGTTLEHAKTRRTCQNILKLALALWTFVTVDGVEPTNNAAERWSGGGAASAPRARRAAASPSACSPSSPRCASKSVTCWPTSPWLARRHCVGSRPPRCSPRHAPAHRLSTRYALPHNHLFGYLSRLAFAAG